MVRWEMGRQRKRSLLCFLSLFSPTTMLLDLLPATLPFFSFLTSSSPSFLCFSPPLLSTLYPFPSYVLLLPSPFLLVHDLLVISLAIAPPPSKK